MLARKIHSKRFVSLENSHGRSGAETVFEYFVDAEGAISGSYAGGQIRIGQLVGKVLGENRIELLFQAITTEGELLSGRSSGVVSRGRDGFLRMNFEWEWLSGEEGGGISSYIEAVAETTPAAGTSV